MKDDDFSELKHPIAAEGDFDPVFGLPIASMSANMAQFVGMIQNDNSKMTVFVDGETDAVSFRYSDTVSDNIVFGTSKNHLSTKDLLPDSILYRQNFSANTAITLFKELENSIGNLEPQGMFTSLKVNLKTHVSDSLLALIDHGVNIYFDELAAVLYDAESKPWDVDLGLNNERININELISGKELTVLPNQDISYMLNIKPSAIGFTMRMNIVVHPSQINPVMLADKIAYITDSLKVVSMDYTVMTNLDFPLQFYCENISYRDTIPLNASNLDSTLNEVEKYLTLNDTGSYIMFTAENYLPLNLSLNAIGYDTVSRTMTMNRIITGDSILKGASLKRNLADDRTISYVSDGFGSSHLKVKLTREIVQQLRKTNALILIIGGNTSTSGASTAKPCVVIRGEDQIKLKAFLSVAPHLHINYPISNQ